MKNELVKNIAEAVLYEGYLLYPYRPSALKNQQRWNFGVLAPEAYSSAQTGSESSTMQTQCLLEGNQDTTLNVEVRFLQLLNREVFQAVAGCGLPRDDCKHRQFASIGNTHFSAVPSLRINGHQYQPLQEAVEREIILPVVRPRLGGGPLGVMYCFPSEQNVETLADSTSGETVGALVRLQEAIEGVVEIRVEDCQIPDSMLPTNSTETLDRLWRVTVEIQNLTLFSDANQKSRDDALMRSLVSTHTILNSKHGRFVSLLDPPDAFRESANTCRNIGTYPVLVGEDGVRGCMLSSPIILYDYPQIAPESAGNLFDGTEIDEILTLRIMTLTDEEKKEILETDNRARQILERTETLPAEQLMKMHGAMKGLNRKS